MKSERFKYHAFLSYAHEDEALVAWLQQVLERSWVPGYRRRNVYRDNDRLHAGPLSERLKTALASSQFLIVCCSTSSAGSKWVNQEIDEFAHAHATPPSHRTQAILACRVDSETEYQLPPALRWVCTELNDELFIPDVSNGLARSSSERCAARHEAFALLAPLLGLPDRDAVYRRQTKSRLLIAVATAAVSLVCAAIWGWTRTDNYQFRTVALASQAVVPAAESHAAIRYLKALAATEYRDLAIESARGTVDRDMRTLALAEVGNGLARTGHIELARQIIAEARTGASAIRDHHVQATALQTIATALLDLRDATTAATAAIEGHQVSLGIEHPELRTGILCDIVQTLSQAGALAAVEAASIDLSVAARDTRTSSGQRAYALTCAAIGTAVSSRAMVLTEALSAGTALTPLRARAETLSSMAELLGAAHLWEAGRAVAETALAAALQLPSGLRQFVLVNRVLPALKGVQLDIDRATMIVLEDATTAAEAATQARGLASLLPWLKDKRSHTELMALAYRARVAVSRVEDPDQRIDVLAQVARDVAKAQLPIALDISRDALSAAAAHTDDRGRSIAYANVAAALVELHRLREARIAAERCSTSDEKLAAYRSIMDASQTKLERGSLR